MMKMTKNVLILSIVGFCMIACSSNETEIELSKSKIAAPTVNGKRLVKIKLTYTSLGETYTSIGETSTSIEYNTQGQVSKVKHHYKDGTTREDTYWYEDRRVIWSPNECIYNLCNGLAVECNYTGLTSLDENAKTVEGRDTYAYDSGGHLIKVTRPDLSDDEHIEIYTNNAWSDDGNIRSVIETESSKVGALFEYEIKYSSIENNIPLFFTHYNTCNFYLEWQGCFGKRCKNLPQSVIYTNRRTMESSWVVHSITYNYDYTSENGLITKISVVSTTDTGTSSKDVYELEWW